MARTPAKFSSLLIPGLRKAFWDAQMLKPRCQSRLWIKLEGGVWHGILCDGEEGHESLHIGHSSMDSGFPQWSDLTADDAEQEMLAETRKVHKRNKPFVGWRTWKTILTDHANELDDDYYCEYHLMSTAAGIKWEGPVMRTGGNEKPLLICNSYNRGDVGVFSYKDPEALLQHFFMLEPLESRATNAPIDGWVPSYNTLGRLDLTGHVVEHELGFRAQVATIRELWIVDRFGPNDTANKMSKQFEKTYQCPVHIFRRLDQIQPWAKFYTQQMREEGQ